MSTEETQARSNFLVLLAVYFKIHLYKDIASSFKTVSRFLQISQKCSIFKATLQLCIYQIRNFSFVLLSFQISLRAQFFFLFFCPQRPSNHFS